ncbi:MAG TPA: OmpA family protein [Polyangia bacterium]|nr:OmpA family protein [Polyangia bacterium]
MKRALLSLACLASALSLVACGIPEEQYNAKLVEIEKLKRDLDAAARSNTVLTGQLDEMRAENQTLAGRLGELGDDVQKLLGEKSLLASDLAQTRDREARLRKEQEAQQARLAKYRHVIEKFRSLVTSGKLKIRIVRGRMVVEMASSILFPSGAAKLSPEGETALGELSRILMTIPDRDFQVAGHTDDVPMSSGKYRSNWELSADRAVSVVKFLQDSGVTPTRLSAAGYSEYQPSVGNDSEEGRATNRRIEIVLMPNLDELPDLGDLEGDLQSRSK